MNSTKRVPSPFVSFLPILLLVSLLIATISTFGTDALNGGSQVALLGATAFCVLLGMAFYRIPWQVYEDAIVDNIKGVSSALIILLVIGALSGSWMISGVIPTLVYYGMNLMHPMFFLASACLVCVLVSVMTGSSWTTIATIGLALMGIGKAQGFPEGWVAGAIISGAYFGDKISPLSETTVLTASVRAVPALCCYSFYAICLNPSSSMFFAALISLSCFVPQTGHTHSLTDRFFVSVFWNPQVEHN